MSKAGDPLTLKILRGVARMAERAGGTTIVDLEDGRYLTLVVVHDNVTPAPHPTTTGEQT